MTLFDGFERYEMGPDGYRDDEGDAQWHDDDDRPVPDYTKEEARFQHDAFEAAHNPTFRELEESVISERINAELDLQNAVENLIALGATADQILTLIHGII